MVKTRRGDNLQDESCSGVVEKNDDGSNVSWLKNDLVSCDIINVYFAGRRRRNCAQET